jgi:hypothetical protein
MLNTTLFVASILTTIYTSVTAGIILGRARWSVLIVIAAIFLVIPEYVAVCYADLIAIIDDYHCPDCDESQVNAIIIAVITIAILSHCLPFNYIFMYYRFARMAYKVLHVL